MCRLSLRFAAIAALLTLASLAQPARADVSNALIINQYNAVGGDKYLKNVKVDPQLGRVEGNGHNWLQFLTTKTDPGKNTLDLRGYEIDWSYDEGDGLHYGSGTMTFTSDPAWSRVPLGTMISVNEWQKSWYLINTPPENPAYDIDGVLAGTPGMAFDGGIDPFGALQGNAYDSNVDKMLDFSTNTAWNPYAQAPSINPAGPNWNMNIWAGQKDLSNNYQYFTYTGSITSDGGVTSKAIGTPDGGLFSVNNDEWRITIKDSQGNVVQGPIGEHVAGWTAGGIGSDEIGKIQSASLQIGANPTLSTWQHIGIADYADGSTSNYGGPTQWTDGTTKTADWSPLRSWFNDIKQGDVNLDGVVNSADITIIASNWLKTGVGLLSGDTNGDGVVNAADITIVASHWLQTGGAPSGVTSTAIVSGAVSVPEPSSCVLCTIGAVIGLAWRLSRRRRR